VRGKPEPEVFLKAAERLGVLPADCVVIEDAVPGVQAAKAAGMGCVVVKSTGHTKEEYGDLEFDRMVNHLDELDLEGLEAVFAE
ncbi:MAG: HAD family phosphatase, partial [Planctomycetota bacterium]